MKQDNVLILLQTPCVIFCNVYKCPHLRGSVNFYKKNIIIKLEKFKQFSLESRAPGHDHAAAAALDLFHAASFAESQGDVDNPEVVNTKPAE